MDRKPPHDYPDISMDPGSEKYLRQLPTTHYWNKTYGISLGGQDQKAARVFRDYESQEKVRRLQAELTSVKDGRVADQVLDVIVGKKRKMKYGGYEKWAALMLLWLANYKK